MFLRFIHGFRRLGLGWVVVIAGWFLGCHSLAMPEGRGLWPVEWSSTLHVTSQAEIANRLAEPWSEPLPVSRLSDGAQAVMTNCLSYFDLTRQGFQSSPVYDQQQEGARCQALRVIRQAVPARQSFLAFPPFTEQIVDVLPPDVGLVISEDDRRRIQEAKARGLSWSETDTIVRVRPRKRERVLIEGAEWGVRLEYYARGDFNGDGFEDLLVKTTGWMSEGTYQVVRLMLLTQTKENGILKLIREYPLS